ncbi:hypothetical protein CIW54_22775 [Paraburkholderia sp. T12-10]|nr:hypothetical protein CIW54_22775 [Paraburkholderia sp. T12-10]
MTQKKYKDSFCRPIVTSYGQRLAGGAARNYRIGQFDDGLDEIIADAISAVHVKLESKVAAKQVIAQAARSSANRSRTGAIAD